MSYQHKSLAAGRWNKMSLVEQMANVGSEVERTLELMDLTLDSAREFSRLRELTRVREALV